jgi:hypothetical protein
VVTSEIVENGCADFPGARLDSVNPFALLPSLGSPCDLRGFSRADLRSVRSEWTSQPYTTVESFTSIPRLILPVSSCSALSLFGSLSDGRDLNADSVGRIEASQRNARGCP